MSGLPHRADAELLLEHASWMRRLARGLVGDAERAEDLSQETWVRALEHPPEAGLPLRGWLAAVMRNLWRQGLRGESRRAQRERASARGEALPSSEELFLRATAQRELVGAVLGLDEPVRTAVLLRYFEGLSPRRIAEREGVPLATVKARLARGLARLRARLDHEHGGDGRGWLAALAPLARGPFVGRVPAASVPGGTAGPLSPLFLGVLTVKAKLLVSLVLAAAFGGVLLAVAVRRPGSAPSPAEGTEPLAAGGPSLAAAAPAEQRASDLAPARGGGEAGVRVALAGEPRPAPAAEPAPERATGRVLDPDGRPLAGVDLVWSGGEEEPLAVEEGAAFAESAGDGSFSWELAARPAGAALVVAAAGPWESVFAASPVDGATVVAAPVGALRGSVTDELGAPLEATVELALPEGLRGRVGAVLDHSRLRHWRTASDARGAFALPRVPLVEGAAVVASADGHRSAREPLPPGGGTLVLVLPRSAPDPGLLAGEVVDVAGRPVAGARVALGFDTTLTDEGGRFAFDLAAEETFNRVAARFFDVADDRLVAVAPGFLPGELVAERSEDGEPVWPARIVLRLGEPALAIAGRVVGPADEPVAGARVWVADPTFFGGLGDPRADRFPRPASVEDQIAGAEPGWRWVETDAAGRFRVDGLLERDYALEAMLSETLLRVRVEGVRAGREGVELRFPTEALYAVVRGRVVDQRGEPVAGVSVAPTCDAFRARYRGEVIQTRHEGLDAVETDAEGRFTLHDVPRDLVYLRLDGADIVPLEWGRAEEGLRALVRGEPGRVTVAVRRRCHFQVLLDDPAEADALRVLDAAREPLEVSEFRAGGRDEGLRHAIVAGRSSVLAVGEGATWLVLEKEGRAVREVPLSLAPGETTVVRP